jgi:lipopolysaccharide transport system permease protein
MSSSFRSSPVPSEPSSSITNSHASSASDHVVKLRPRAGWQPLDLQDLWQYRELGWILAARDIRVRYTQTALGAAWALIQPFFTMLVFSIFFGRLGKIPSDNLPYPIFAYCALVVWQMFAYSLVESSNSLVTNERLISKVYFPRLLIPLSSILSALADFCIAFVLLLAMGLYYGITPGLAILTLPLWLLLALTTSLGVGLWLSALNIQYRDVRYVIPFLVQVWLFTTPVAYPSSMVPDKWRAFYGLNPMAGVVEGFRWAMLGTKAPDSGLLIASVSAALLLLLSGLLYFRRTEKHFADVV